jgi:hypothetical protein
MSIETTHRHAAALRRSDLCRGRNTTEFLYAENSIEAYAQLTPTESGRRTR